jgi:hypothetical protein
MERVIRNVKDIERADRQTLERVLGHSLRANQQLVIDIVQLGESATPSAGTVHGKDDRGARLPEWCNVYEGLTDEEITELEQVILRRADLSRPSV